MFMRKILGYACADASAYEYVHALMNKVSVSNRQKLAILLKYNWVACYCREMRFARQPLP